MNNKLILAAKRSSSPWSGGRTSELLLFPEDATPVAKNYLFRISVASILDKQTIFSNFAGYQRIHLLLSGESTLFVDKRARELNDPFAMHAFDGGARCACFLGSQSASALNIIYRKEVQATVTAPIRTVEVFSLKLEAGSRLSETCPELEHVSDVFYCANGSVTISTDDSSVKLDTGDTFVVQRSTDEAEVTLGLQGTAELVHVQLLVPKGLR